MTVRRVSGVGVKLTTALRELDGYVGKTGYFETARYPDGTPVAYVATVHEFGSAEQGIPARPTMRPAAIEHERDWADTARAGAAAALRGEIPARDVLELVALQAAGHVGDEIQALRSPPLKPHTVARKGFDKPLIDTSLMFQSVTGVVERKA